LRDRARRGAEARMPVLDQLRELRRRVIVVVVIVAVGAVFGWIFYGHLLDIL
jgi:sec-independent protein translocase protein TatC